MTIRFPLLAQLAAKRLAEIKDEGEGEGDCLRRCSVGELREMEAILTAGASRAGLSDPAAPIPDAAFTQEERERYNAIVTAAASRTEAEAEAFQVAEREAERLARFSRSC